MWDLDKYMHVDLALPCWWLGAHDHDGFSSPNWGVGGSMPTVGCELCKLTVHDCLVTLLNISEVLNSWAPHRNTKQEIAQDLKFS